MLPIYNILWLPTVIRIKYKPLINHSQQGSPWFYLISPLPALLTLFQSHWLILYSLKPTEHFSTFSICNSQILSLEILTPGIQMVSAFSDSSPIERDSKDRFSFMANPY